MYMCVYIYIYIYIYIEFESLSYSALRTRALAEKKPPFRGKLPYHF